MAKQTKDFEERVKKTNIDLAEIFSKSLTTMLKVNEQRGDAWRGVGLIGCYLEIRTMFLRLRNLCWHKKASANPTEHAEWKAAVINALEDLRNYTMLAELSIMEDNLEGIEELEKELTDD